MLGHFCHCHGIGIGPAAVGAGTAGNATLFRLAAVLLVGLFALGLWAPEKPKRIPAGGGGKQEALLLPKPALTPGMPAEKEWLAAASGRQGVSLRERPVRIRRCWRREKRHADGILTLHGLHQLRLNLLLGLRAYCWSTGRSALAGICRLPYCRMAAARIRSAEAASSEGQNKRHLLKTNEGNWPAELLTHAEYVLNTGAIAGIRYSR